MTYRIRFLRRANRDVDFHAGWIARRSPPGAERWLKALAKVVTQILQNPLGFGLAQERSLRRHGVHAAPFKTRQGNVYRLLFFVDESEVRVLRVRGPGQRPVRLSEIEFDDPPELDDLS